MSEYFADFVLALRDAEDVAKRLRTELPDDAAGEQAELNGIADELGALRQEMAVADTLPLHRAGEIVEQLRTMLLRSSNDRLISLILTWCRRSRQRCVGLSELAVQFN